MNRTQLTPQQRGVARTMRHAILLAIFASPAFALAQPTPADPAAHRPATSPAEMTRPSQPMPPMSLADQVQELRAKVARLESGMQPKPAGMRGGTSSTMRPMGGMGMMAGMMGGEMGGTGMGSTRPMPGGGSSGMDQGMMGMMGMPPDASMGGMAMPTALPGFPGASHLYHIGSSGFFLDHGQHITLTTDQQTALNQVKERALLARADSQRKIDAAEQELWTLTASDQPDAAKIEAKVQEIEKLRGDQRLAFIRSVGDAAKLLTDEQRKSLLGQLPPQSQSSPPASGGMGGGGMGGGTMNGM